MPTVYSLPWFFQQFMDGNGDPLAGGYVSTKYAGTSDDKATYSDSAGTTPYDNPIDLDSSGMPDAGPIFLQAGAYDFYVYDTNDVLVDTIEGINAQTATTEVDTVADMKALTGGSPAIVRTLGYSAANDGGGWWFYWDADSTDSDDGGMVIQPDSLPASGRWLGLLSHTGELDLKTYGAACDGSTDDVTELQACDTYCAANGLNILISDHTYFSTDPSLSSKIKLLPGCQLRWGNINPTLDVVIDGNDKTQHFNNSASYYPVLNVSEFYPEWFGETSPTDPISTLVRANITNEKTKFLSNIYLSDTAGIMNHTGSIGSSGNISSTAGNIQAVNGSAIAGTGSFDTLITATHTPSSASDTGEAGTICWDADYIYICITTDTWKRVAISTW